MNFMICLISVVLAAPQIKTPFEKNELKQALQQHRLADVKKMGPQGYKQLHQMMHSENESMEQRWQAILAIAKIGREESRRDLEQNLQSPTWFVRSASLLGLSLIQSGIGEQKAKELMSKDRALLVRATALQVLSQSKKIDRTFLWKELHNPINFHQGRSLSLRTSIVKVLAQNPKKGEIEKFSFLLKEGDSEIRQLSQQALAQAFTKKL
jgi:HEAT repeat protein